MPKKPTDPSDPNAVRPPEPRGGHRGDGADPAGESARPKRRRRRVDPGEAQWARERARDDEEFAGHWVADLLRVAGREAAEGGRGPVPPPPPPAAGSPPDVTPVHVAALRHSFRYARYWQSGQVVNYDKIVEDDREFDPFWAEPREELGPLAASILRDGIREPLLVRPVSATSGRPRPRAGGPDDAGRYEVVSGWRRVLAVKWLTARGVDIPPTAGRHAALLRRGFVPVKVLDVDDLDAVLIAAAENWPTLSPWERAGAAWLVSDVLKRASPELLDGRPRPAPGPAGRVRLTSPEVVAATSHRMRLGRRDVERYLRVAECLSVECFVEAGFVRPQGAPRQTRGRWFVDWPLIRAVSLDTLVEAADAVLRAGEGEAIARLQAVHEALSSVARAANAPPAPAEPGLAIQPRLSRPRRNRAEPVDQVARYLHARANGDTIRIDKPIDTYSVPEARAALDKLAPVAAALAERLFARASRADPQTASRAGPAAGGGGAQEQEADAGPPIHIQPAGRGTLVVIPAAAADLTPDERQATAAALRELAAQLEASSAGPTGRPASAASRPQ